LDATKDANSLVASYNGINKKESTNERVLTKKREFGSFEGTSKRIGVALWLC